MNRRHSSDALAAIKDDHKTSSYIYQSMRVNSPVVFSIKLEQKYVRACSTRNLTGLSADPCTPETLQVSICVYEQAPTAPIACRYELFSPALFSISHLFESR